MDAPVTKAQYFVWNSQYETGDDMIDSQHQVFILLLNKLCTLAHEDFNKQFLFRVLHELQSYTVFHFLSEENMMMESRYPGFGRHQQLHSDILIELELLIGRVANQKAQAMDVVNFFRKWIFDHILKEDKHVALHLTSTCASA